MTPDRWQRIEELYHSARDREGSVRIAFLNEACAGDEALRQEIESLLAEEKEAKGFLESPALEIAAKQTHLFHQFSQQDRELVFHQMPIHCTGRLTPVRAAELRPARARLHGTQLTSRDPHVAP